MAWRRDRIAAVVTVLAVLATGLGAAGVAAGASLTRRTEPPPPEPLVPFVPVVPPIPRDDNGWDHGHRHRRHHHPGNDVYIYREPEPMPPPLLRQPPVTPTQPAVPKPAVPAQDRPPDPRGPHFRSFARGAAPDSPALREGEPLPPGLPHVTLDWRAYGLPEPPPGLVYARVGREVFLIEPATRRIERRVDPTSPDVAK